MFAYSRRRSGAGLDHRTELLSVTLAVLTLLAGVLPAAVAYVGALIVDAVIHAAELHRRTGATALADVLQFVALEALLVAAHFAGPARPVAGAIAAARAARAAGQRHDPREGADAGADAIRGLRVLRQADARTPRGLEPALEPGHAHLRSACRTPSRWSPSAACWCASRPGRWCCWCSPACRRSSPRRSSPAKRSGCSAGARPSRACRSTSSRCWRARTRQGGQAVPAGAAAARPLPGHLHAPVPRGSRPHRCAAMPGASGLGCSGTGALYGGYAWIAAETVLGAMTVGQMTMYLMLFRQGQSAVSAALSGGRRPVRGQPVPVESVRVPRTAGR